METEMHQLPADRLKELLPELKESLIPIDYSMILGVYNLTQAHETDNPAFRKITENQADYLDTIADKHSFYRSNRASRELLKTAIGIIREF